MGTKKRAIESLVAEKLVTRELVRQVIKDLHVKSNIYVNSCDQIPKVGAAVYSELLHERFIPQIAEIVGQKELSFVRLNRAALRAAKPFILEYLREEGHLDEPSLKIRIID